MFEKKLLALKYEQPSINVENETEFRDIVYWLECTKIRSYQPKDRNSLLSSNKTWNQSFDKYLNDINYQQSRNDKKVILDWLLNLALRIEMEDVRLQMHMSIKEITDLISSRNQVDTKNIDICSEEFINGLKEFAHIMNVPFVDDEPLLTLKAIAILLCKLRKSSKNSDDSELNNSAKRKKLINNVDENILKKCFSENSKYDPILNHCANVLRLLYIKDLRELQTEINNIIVKIQSITANPKTDSSLGKIGK